MRGKFQAERGGTSEVEGDQVKGNLGAEQKLLMCSGLQLNIDGLQNIEYTNKIESFTIKQGIKQLYTGAEWFPQIEPTKIEFPALTGTIRARVSRSIPALAATSIPSIEAMKLV